MAAALKAQLAAKGVTLDDTQATEIATQIISGIAGSLDTSTLAAAVADTAKLSAESAAGTAAVTGAKAAAGTAAVTGAKAAAGTAAVSGASSASRDRSL